MLRFFALLFGFVGLLGIAFAQCPPPPSGQTEVDDTDSSVIFSRSSSSAPWMVGVNPGNPQTFGGSAHYNNACQNPPQSVPIQGPMAAINFTGTSITLIGATGNNFGIGAYAIDGGPLTTADAYDPSSAANFQRPLFTVSGLSSGSHVLTYQITCNKNPASSNFYQVVDAYMVTGSSLPLSSAQVGPWNGVNLTGSWSSLTDGSDLSGGQIWSEQAGATISWTFTGSLIEMYGRPDVGDGFFDVYIDNMRVAQNVDGHYGTIDNDLLTGYMLWAGKVSPGTHTIKIVVDGTRDAYNGQENSGLKFLVQFDQFLAFP